MLAAGSRYTYTVNVNATGLTLEGCTIGDWESGDGESGTAEDLGYFIQDDGSYTVYTANGLLAWNEAAQHQYDGQGVDTGRYVHKLLRHFRRAGAYHHGIEYLIFK